jgi:hypothetical protein
MAIKNEAELADAILEDIRPGDQGGRADVVERFAAYVERRAALMHAMLADLDRISSKAVPIPDKLRRDIDASVADFDDLAAAVRRGDVSVDQESAEFLLRAVPVVAMLAP